jgi:hypothetical protein
VGLKAVGAWYRETEVAHAVLRDLETELSEAWNRLGWDLYDPSVSDESIMARRAALMPDQLWATGLRAALLASQEAMWAGFEARNPKPKGAEDWP